MRCSRTELLLLLWADLRPACHVARMAGGGNRQAVAAAAAAGVSKLFSFDAIGNKNNNSVSQALAGTVCVATATATTGPVVRSPNQVVEHGAKCTDSDRPFHHGAAGFCRLGPVPAGRLQQGCKSSRVPLVPRFVHLRGRASLHCWTCRRSHVSCVDAARPLSRGSGIQLQGRPLTDLQGGPE